MQLYKSSKQIVTFQNNAVAFLNGLTSNAMDKPWNAFVNIHGMVIATFDQFVLNEDEVWIALERFCVDDVSRHLERYAKLSGVQIKKKENLFVYFDCAADGPVENGDFFIPQKKGRLIITERPLLAHMSDAEFTLFRLRNNIPLHGVDYKDDFLLNVSEAEYVSYTKGCFLGQEPISKVHSRSRPSWKLAVKAASDCTLKEKTKMTSKVTDPVTKKVIGFVFVSNKD